MRMRSRLRTIAGALLYDWLPFEWNLRRGGWVRVRNRRERLIPSARSPGVTCDWRWSSDLHIHRVFPSAGRRLLRAAMAEWPIRFRDAPLKSGPPEVSFVIGHRGEERAPLLLLTLAAIAAQEDVACEAIVIEQSEAPRVRSLLPPWVRHVHTPPPDHGMLYSRSWALNVGIRHAAAPVVIPCDNDLLIPARYGAEARDAIAAGADIVDLKRFVFYLGAADTRRLVEMRAVPSDAVPENVTQNLQGGSLIATPAAMEAIGGFDESLSGWGGEDNELWERAASLRRVAAGYLPLVHLWHAPQQEKLDGASAPAIRRYGELHGIPIDRRIDTLRRRGWGSLDGPRGENG